MTDSLPLPPIDQGRADVAAFLAEEGRPPTLEELREWTRTWPSLSERVEYAEGAGTSTGLTRHECRELLADRALREGEAFVAEHSRTPEGEWYQVSTSEGPAVVWFDGVTLTAHPRWEGRRFSLRTLSDAVHAVRRVRIRRGGAL